MENKDPDFGDFESELQNFLSQHDEEQKQLDELKVIEEEISFEIQSEITKRNIPHVYDIDSVLNIQSIIDAKKRWKQFCIDNKSDSGIDLDFDLYDSNGDLVSQDENFELYAEAFATKAVELQSIQEQRIVLFLEQSLMDYEKARRQGYSEDEAAAQNTKYKKREMAQIVSQGSGVDRGWADLVGDLAPGKSLDIDSPDEIEEALEEAKEEFEELNKKAVDIANQVKEIVMTNEFTDDEEDMPNGIGALRLSNATMQLIMFINQFSSNKDNAEYERESKIREIGLNFNLGNDTVQEIIDLTNDEHPLV